MSEKSRTCPECDREFQRWERQQALLVANIAMLRDQTRWELSEGADPVALTDKVFGFIEGFVLGTQAMVVPPELVPPDELRAAIERGRELAEERGW